MDVWPVLKWLLPSGAVAGAYGYVAKRLNDSRERQILDLLEQAGQPVSVGIIHNEFIRHVMRGVKASHVLPKLRPGGDPSNEADSIPAKTPFRIRIRHRWRVSVMRQLPSEEKVRDILRSMKAKGFVEFAGDDSWILRR